MIVAETERGYQFVTQPAHADLAGQFADHWGNEAFASPDPEAAMVTAAYTHDVGWTEYDLQPHLGDDGTPVDFREMPADVWTELYDDGVDSVVDVDRYAGLLVSMHGAGLRNQRYGLSESWPATPEEFEAFVERQEARQRELAEALSGAGEKMSEADAELLASLQESGTATEGTDSRLWRNYKLLQAWDELSLAFCVTDEPPGYSPIEAVPTGADSGDENLTIEALGNGEYRVEPFPFDESPLTVSVPVRTVESGEFDDSDELRYAYYSAGVEDRSIRLVQE